MTRHGVRALTMDGRRALVDGHPICTTCDDPAVPVGRHEWRHPLAGEPYPYDSRWLRPMTPSEVLSAPFYAGLGVSSEDWREACRRLRAYLELPVDGPNPLLERVAVLAGGRPGPGEIRVPPGIARVLDLDGRRRELASRYAWAIPTEAAPGLAGDYGPLLEVGAGTGYWASLLQARGVDVVATDVAPPASDPPASDPPASDPPASDRLRDRMPFVDPLSGAPADSNPPGFNLAGSDPAGIDPLGVGPLGVGPLGASSLGASPLRGGNAYHRAGRVWTRVEPVAATEAVRAYPGRTLLMCWPPPDDDAAGYAALRACAGDVLVYVGGGADGPTGTLRLHAELGLNWTVTDELALPSWPGISDRLTVWRRNPRRRPLRARNRCPQCARFMPTAAAGRCDRCFAQTPPALALKSGPHRIEYPAAALDAMPPALRRALESSPNRLV